MSNKIVLGLVLGGVLGILDGLTAWFTPAVRAGIVGIVFGSMIKGLIAGVLIGVFARKVHSLALGIIFGLAVGAFPDHASRSDGRLDRRLRHAKIWRFKPVAAGITELAIGARDWPRL